MRPEREFRLEALSPGDRFWWQGGWRTIRRFLGTGLLSTPTVAVVVDDGTEGGTTFLFPVGFFVGALIAVTP